MSVRTEPEGHYCPYLERILVMERKISGNGLEASATRMEAALDRIESDEFAVEIGNKIARHAWGEIGRGIGKGIIALIGFAGVAILKIAGVF